MKKKGEEEEKQEQGLKSLLQVPRLGGPGGQGGMDTNPLDQVGLVTCNLPPWLIGSPAHLSPAHLSSGSPGSPG